MLLGAFVDAGAPLGALQAAIEAVIPGTVRLSVSTVHRAGMRATKVDVDRVAEDLPHRQWTEIRSLLENADLKDAVRARAVAVFVRLAEAEAQAHGVRVEDVCFHEVGAWDSIADVVGVAAALQALGVRSVTAGPVALGSGTIRTAHAQMPVPVPAVLELSAGWRVFSGGAGELATPTGMAVVVALADACEELPELDVTAVGVGAGTREDERRPNVVRVVIGTLPVSPATSDAVVLEANVDDLDPRVWPSVLAALLEAGADDAWLIPTLAKKGRPAHTLAVLAAPERMPELRARVFALVPTLGVRETRVRKTALERAWRTVEFDGVSVRVKLAHIRGEIVTATPEFEDVALVAAASGKPVRHVLSQAVAAAVLAGLTPGRSMPN